MDDTKLPRATCFEISSKVSSKPWKYYKKNDLILDNYTSLTRMHSNYIYICHCNTNQHVLYTPTFFPAFNKINMQAEEYWPMAWEYGIWNAATVSLQFWTEDLAPVTLGEASECVYQYFFWTPVSHTLCQLPEETLFGCFVLALNAAFMQKLSSQDGGYESGSNEDVPTPLHTTPHIQHVSSLEHASFKPAHSTPHRPVTCTPTQSPCKPVRHHLSFNNDSMDTPNSSSSSSPAPSDLEEEEEDFQTVPLDDDFLVHRNGPRMHTLYTWIWTTKQCMFIPMPLWE